MYSITIKDAVIYLLLFGAVTYVVYFLAPFISKGWLSYQKKKIEKTGAALEDSFTFVSPGKLTSLIAVFSLSAGIVGFLLVKNIFGFLGGLLIGSMLPPLYAKQQRKHRQKVFVKQLNDILMILSSSLRGGLSLVQAFEAVAEEIDRPAKDEFSLLAREIRMGVPVEDALKHLAQRMPSEEIDLINSAIFVARETGGDITKTFSNLVNTMRDRERVKEMVETLTLQGRLQGIIMSALPVVFLWLVYKTNPHTFKIMLNDPAGRFLLILAGILEVIALILIRIFSKVKV